MASEFCQLNSDIGTGQQVEQDSRNEFVTSRFFTLKA
jgi:hypothetical protein